MTTQELDEFDVEEFDTDEYVERLAWRTNTGTSRSGSGNFDAMKMHAAFEQAIDDLKQTSNKVQRRVEKLELQCKDEVKSNQMKSQQLLGHNQEAFKHFKALDERINFVATKAVHLGDQLEGVNTPRTRAAEALMLIKYFSEFMSNEQPTSELFTDPNQLQGAAEVIEKLYLMAQELPPKGDFDMARQRIITKYQMIQHQLLQEFRAAHHKGDKKQMKRLAFILSHFRDYNHCIDIFVEETQKGAYRKPDLYQDIPSLCEKSYALINEVFNNPDTIMAKLVQNIYHVKIQTHLETRLKHKLDLESYLQNLYKLYEKTLDLSEKLSVYKFGNDTTYLTKLTKQIFSKYLDTYIHDETRFLRDRCSLILQRYFESKNHQKKNVQSGGIHEFRRDLQAVIGAKTNINIGPTIENYGGETFLSQEVAINVLQESKLAFKRCKLLSSRQAMPINAHNIFEILALYLVHEHIDYALELGLQAIPLPDAKTEPALFFFDVVGQANTIFHLFEKQFSDSLLPQVSNSPKHSECLQRKHDIVDSIETKVDIGLDRTISAMIGWTKQILMSEQKKTDFKPESEEGPMQMFSPAIVKYINSQLDPLHFGLDGKNVDAVLTEFGIRFHRVVYEHLQQFQYNSMGAMLAICDVNEYRKCVKEFHIPLVIELFDTLHALCNLLVVVPDNLKQVSHGDQLANLDKNVIHSFVQLRADYKTARLAIQFR
ncbi:hypothetical protein LSH36_102g02090 [Paralvinella palmiformis]|uniref:Exocyst complex component 5 n=1 Tax=Paralvinella palmiformis TaxID=53620 RepID=A0AAD9N9L3_9ANNE|nr:hypothetical protein LSH36_102g02090 [Paralvinella palmiformis]